MRRGDQHRYSSRQSLTAPRTSGVDLSFENGLIMRDLSFWGGQIGGRGQEARHDRISGMQKLINRTVIVCKYIPEVNYCARVGD